MGQGEHSDGVVLSVSAIGEDGTVWVDTAPITWGSQLVLNQETCKRLGLEAHRPVLLSPERLAEFFLSVEGVAP